jgi:hypothetical protein
MFSFVITIISIALVVVLAAATLYYGGTPFEKASERADIARVLQEANQISGALELYKADNGSFPSGTPTEIAAALVEKKYLTEFPNPEKWSFTNDYIVQPIASESQCLAINAKLGVDTVPSCSDPAFANKSVCCMSP